MTKAGFPSFAAYRLGCRCEPARSRAGNLRPGIIGALTLCLSLTGCLATKYEFGGVGFRVIPSGLPLYQAEETVPDETAIPRTEYLSSPVTSAAIARYFDMQLGLEDLHPERPSNPYMRTEGADSSAWAFRNEIANTALWLRDLDRDPLKSFASPGSLCIGWLPPDWQSIPIHSGDRQTPPLASSTPASTTTALLE